MSEYTSIKKLGCGTTSDVYLCSNNEGKLCAMKCYKSSIDNFCKNNEVEILKELEHPNIISLLDQGDDFATFELATNGEIFDYALAKPFEVQLARYYFIQLINVLDYIHQQNICHRDLKLENMFLDESFALKVGDFGLAGHIKDHNRSSEELSSPNSSQCSTASFQSECSSYSSYSSDDNNYFYESVGTENYMAPELINKQKYFGEQVDIFALGVILFSLTHGFPPYQKKAHKSDPFYRLILEKKYTQYWSVLEKKTKVRDDPDFMDLINKLLEPNPSERITLDDIKTHPWVHGDIYLHEEIVSQMELRKQMIEEQQ